MTVAGAAQTLEAVATWLAFVVVLAACGWALDVLTRRS